MSLITLNNAVSVAAIAVAFGMTWLSDRKPAVGRWWFAFAAVFFAAGAAANAVLGSWGWAIFVAVMSAANAGWWWSCWQQGKQDYPA